MLNKKVLLIVLVALFAALTSCAATDYTIKELKLDTQYKEVTKGNVMNIYSAPIVKDLKENSDFVVEASLENKVGIFDTPLIFISTKPLPNTTKDNDKWICGQLGKEHCFVPVKYLKGLDKVYIGVLCNECHFNIKLSFIQEVALPEGETKLFHLKQGDSKVFSFIPNVKNADFIQILSFNLKMSKYTMKVDIVDNAEPSKVINGPVSENWIGGKQLLLKKDAHTNLFQKEHKYLITITALESGVFNLEAITSNTIISLEDKNLKLQSITKGQDICYQYKIEAKDAKEDVTIDVKPIKGSVNFIISKDKVPTAKAFDFTFDAEKEHKFNLSSALRKGEAGNWFICSNTKDEYGLYAIQVYLSLNTAEVQDYKKLLLSLIKSKGIYDINNLLTDNKYTQHKSLVEAATKSRKLNDAAAPTSATIAAPVVPATATAAATAAATPAAEPTRLLITGNGVGGIAVGFLFLFIFMSGFFAASSIFVNTKLIKNPLLLGKVDY